MNEKIENLLELPVGHRVGILCGSMFLVVVVYYFSFFSLTGGELSETKAAMEGPKGLRAQITEQQNIARNLDKFLAQVEELDVELKKALAQLPDKKEIHQLLTQVSDKARDSGLEVRLFKPTGEQKKDFYADVPVQIEVSGTYHQVATFFDEVGHLDRIVNLDGLSMVEPDISDDAVLLKTQVTATAFRFLDEGERPDAEGGADGKGASRKRRAAKPTEKIPGM